MYSHRRDACVYIMYVSTLLNIVPECEYHEYHIYSHRRDACVYIMYVSTLLSTVPECEYHIYSQRRDACGGRGLMGKVPLGNPQTCEARPGREGAAPRISAEGEGERNGARRKQRK
ncbi:hypothetical protein NDU88_005230 [Pleurodeles waltl]|uniref:Uncharacterized protein n=1 Tax=Pleurodeles waltl TaxID=8319 RepID=A0AAV7L3U4_PLEWA|nr:hypothetical protein NDU88_005230 [Pleurodeles waltl]